MSDLDGGIAQAESDGGLPRAYDDGPASFLPLPSLGQFAALQTYIAQINLEIDPASLAALDASPASDTVYPAIMDYDGIQVAGTMRYRGESTRALAQKSFKFVLTDGHVDHRDHFDLLAEYMDSGKLAEKFSIDLRTAMGQRVPFGKYALVSVNGKLNGLYLDMQKTHKGQLLMFGLEPDARVFRCGGRNCEMKTAPAGTYQMDYEFQNVYAGSQQPDLQALLQFINRTDDGDFEAGIGQRIDLDGYVGCLAAHALMSENIVEDTEGWWIHETRKDLWSFIPWDLNHSMMLWYRTWGTNDPPIVNHDARVFSIYDDQIQVVFDQRKTIPNYRPTWSVLNTRMWRRPSIRNKILDKIAWALNGPFSPSQAGAHLDALWALVQGPLSQDPFLDKPHASVALQQYKAYVAQRGIYLNSQLAYLRNFQGNLVINEVGFGSTSAPGYVELYNKGSTPIALGGMAITDDLRNYNKQKLAAGLWLPPQGHFRLVADGRTDLGNDHVAFTLDQSGGEIGIFDGTHVNNPLDLIYFGPHASGTAYGRFPDGAEDYRVMPQTPGAPNQ